MRIHATFASRKYDPDVVELIDAWDEYSVDENPEGFEQSRNKAIASWGDDLLRWATVRINVDMTEVYKALDPRIEVRGEVLGIDGSDT